jgi:hypothetical protein
VAGVNRTGEASSCRGRYAGGGAGSPGGHWRQGGSHHVAGVWHLRRSGRRIQITVEQLERVAAAHRRELDEQADRVGEILEATPA